MTGCGKSTRSNRSAKSAKSAKPRTRTRTRTRTARVLRTGGGHKKSATVRKRVWRATRKNQYKNKNKNNHKNKGGGPKKGSNKSNESMFSFARDDRLGAALEGTSQRYAREARDDKKRERSDAVSNIAKLRRKGTAESVAKANSEQAFLDYHDQMNSRGIVRGRGHLPVSAATAATWDTGTSADKTYVSKNFTRMTSGGKYYQENKVEKTDPGPDASDDRKSFYEWQQWWQNDAPDPITLRDGTTHMRFGHGPLDMTEKDPKKFGKPAYKRVYSHAGGVDYVEEVPIYMNRKGYDDAKKAFDRSEEQKAEYLGKYNARSAAKAAERVAKDEAIAKADADAAAAKVRANAASAAASSAAPRKYTYSWDEAKNMSVRALSRGGLMASVFGANNEAEAKTGIISDVSRALVDKFKTPVNSGAVVHDEDGNKWVYSNKTMMYTMKK